MRLPTTAVVFLLTSQVARAQLPLDTVMRLDGIAREVVRIGARHGEAMWPGFRPDTIPVSFVLPSHGDVLFGWRGALPKNYVAIPQLPGAAWREQRAPGAASTGTMLDGRHVAQVVVNGFGPVLAATAVHEAFHVFENASRREGRKFGRGENSMLVSTYPVFDVEDETAFALEGRILAEALSTTTTSGKRELARAFTAVRRDRHRKLPQEFATFDAMSELHEGLAEYVLVRTLMIESKEGPTEWRVAAARALASRRRLLSELTHSENLSLRFRYYQTGPALALLLDALRPNRWKQELLAGDATLQDMLARASGADDDLIAANTAFNATSLRAETELQIRKLKARRRATADSLLALPGLMLILSADSLPGRAFNPCGYDPQNLLQVAEKVQIQMRWWKPCAGGPTHAEFNVPSVYDENLGTIAAVIGEEALVKLTSNGQPLVVRDGETLRDVRSIVLEAPRASVQAVRADISRSGSTLRIVPKRP